MLRAIKLGEADRIVTIFTQGHGKVRAVAKGIRKTDEQVRRPARADEPGRVAVLPGPRARHRHPGRDDRLEPGAARGLRAAHARDPDARSRRPGRPGARAQPGAVPDAHGRAAHARRPAATRSSRRPSSGSCSRSRASTRCSTRCAAVRRAPTTPTPSRRASWSRSISTKAARCAARARGAVAVRSRRKALDLLRRMLGGGLNGVLAETARRRPRTRSSTSASAALEHHVERRMRSTALL